MRFTIWRKTGSDMNIIGTYPGATEQEALDNASKDGGYADFADANKKLSLSRDDYKVKQVE
jgi:hypothetical protein